MTRKIKIIVLHILFFLFVCTPLFSVENTKVTFFNVGQGDCTIIESPENGILIIDGGSSNTEGIKDLDESNKIESLSHRVFNYLLPKIKLDTKINFIITHSDKDHLNLIGSIITNIKRLFPLKVMGILLGGNENEYKKEDGLKLVQILNTTDDIHYFYSENIFSEQELYFKVQERNPNWLQTLGCWDDSINYFSIKKEIVSLSQVAKKPKIDNPNDSSIVMKLNINGKSLIITGDKGETQLLMILARTHIAENSSTLSPLKTNILLSTHHGSRKECCLDWLNKTKPEYIIISSGRSYGHPSQKTIEKYANVSSLNSHKDNLLHFIEFSDDPEIDPLSSMEIRQEELLSFQRKNIHIIYLQHPSKLTAHAYKGAITTKNILMTSTQGNIELEIETDVEKTYITPKCSFLQHSLYDEIAHVTKENYIKALYLYALDIDNIMTFVRKNFIGDETRVSYIHDGLEEFHLIKSDSEDKIHYNDEIAEKLSEFIKHYNKINKLTLSGCQFSSVGQEIIIKAWGNRGLYF